MNRDKLINIITRWLEEHPHYEFTELSVNSKDFADIHQPGTPTDIFMGIKLTIDDTLEPDEVKLVHDLKFME